MKCDPPYCFPDCLSFVCLSMRRCLIAKGEAFYSVFLSYRVKTDAPHARLLFDELNHRLTAALSLDRPALRLNREAQRHCP